MTELALIVLGAITAELLLLPWARKRSWWPR
jgi:hypothetical protein